MLLHSGTRHAVGLPLDGNVVVIDEAHNLLETIESIHSVALPLLHLRLARDSLAEYVLKYQSRLSPANLSKIRELARCVGLLAAFLDFQRAPSWLFFSFFHLIIYSCPHNNGVPVSFICCAVDGAVGTSQPRVMGLFDFLAAAKLDMDFFELEAFCEQSKIGNKVGEPNSFFIASFPPPLTAPNNTSNTPRLV